MALDVYFKEDVHNILRATLVASEGSAALVAELLKDPDLDQASAGKLMYVYERGFASALGAIALAFGLDVLPLGRERTPQPKPGQLAEQRSLYGRSPPRALSSGADGEHLEELDLGGFLRDRSEYERRQG